MALNFHRIRNGVTLTPQSGAPSSPTSGDLYYDSVSNTYSFYDNGFWINLASKADVASAADLTSAQLTAAIVQNPLVRITGSTATNVHGLAASTSAKQVLLYNQTTTTVIIKNNSVTEGTAANRIVTATGGDLTLKTGRTILFVYDSGQSRWVTATSPSSGSGSGTGDDLDALQYNASLTDTFDTPSSDATSTVDASAGHTNATYDAVNQAYTMSYDASKTVTGTGTSMTLSGTPSFTVVAGDMLRVGTEARKISTVTTQTAYTLESAFSSDPSAAAATVSQAVYSKDLNNFAADGIAISAIYTDNISEALVTYNDTSSGALYNPTDPALVAFTASSNGTTYTLVQAREANLSTATTPTTFSTNSTNLYIRFFSNKTSGSGTVNLVGYKTFFHRNSLTETGGILNQAYCFTDGTGTPVNCSDPTVVAGKSQITLTFSYPIGVNSGTANGSLLVYIDGKKVPRFINATLTPNASYTETGPNTITLDSNYSSFNFEVEIFQFVSVIDTNTANTTNITTINSHRFRNYVINGNFDFWQRATSFSTPASGSYTADRFLLSYDGSIGTFTVSQQAFTVGQTDVPNEPTWFWRWNQTVAGSGSTNREVQHRVQSSRTLANKTATLTFYAKADTSRSVGVTLVQDFGTGGSPSGEVSTSQQTASLTTTWQLFTMVFVLPSIAGKTYGTNNNDFLAIVFDLPINTTMTIDLAQVMLNEGSVAAPWVYASGGAHLDGIYAAELALCQLYCQTFGKAPDQTNNAYGSGFAATTTSSLHYMKFHRPMRANPTMTTTAADWAIQRNTGAVITATTIGFNNVGTASGRVGLNVAAGLTAGEGLIMITNNQNGMILEAEL